MDLQNNKTDPSLLHYLEDPDIWRRCRAFQVVNEKVYGSKVGYPTFGSKNTPMNSHNFIFKLSTFSIINTVSEVNTS